MNFHFLKGVAGGNVRDFGEIRFGSEYLAVVHRGDNHSGVPGIILS